MGFGDWLTEAGNSISDGWDAATDSETYVKAYNSAADGISSAYDSTASALGTAKDWVVDTGAPVAGEVLAHTGSVILSPIALASEMTGIGNDTSVIRGISERAGNVGGAISGFTMYAIEEPERATAMVGQGITNGVTAIVGLVPMAGGLVVDAGRGIWNGATYVTGAPLRGLINLGLEDDQEIDNFLHIGSDKVFAVTVAGMGVSKDLHDATQLRNAFKDNEGWQAAFAPISNQVMINGVLTDNPNAGYERTLLYGPQVITETAAFIALSAATGGTAGVVMGSLRVGKGGQQVAQGVKTANTVRTGATGAEATAAAGTAEGTAATVEVVAQVSDDVVRVAAKSSDDITRGTAANDAAATTAKTQQGTAGSAATAEGEAVAQTAQTSDKVVQINTQVNQAAANGQNATAQLTAVESETLIASSENVIQMNAKMAQVSGQAQSTTVEMQGAIARTVNGPSVTVVEGSSTATGTSTATITNVAPTVTTVETGATAANEAFYLTRMQSAMEGGVSGLQKGADWANPFTQGKWGLRIETAAVGAGFWLGWNADVKAAEQRSEASKAGMNAIIGESLNEIDAQLNDAENFWGDPSASTSPNLGQFQSKANGTSGDGHVSEYSQSGSTGNNFTFNNRANGTVQPTEGATSFVIQVDADSVAAIKASLQS
ncbi:MAG: hypothetical protein ACRBCK_04760 [Alphaproteobacteria bacterium]